jgi:hypothetical protein
MAARGMHNVHTFERLADDRGDDRLGGYGVAALSARHAQPVLISA